MTPIKAGDKVRASYFREKFNRRTGQHDKEFLFSKHGVVEMVSRGKAAVRFDNALKIEMVAVTQLEKV